MVTSKLNRGFLFRFFKNGILLCDANSVIFPEVIFRVTNFYFWTNSETSRLGIVIFDQAENHKQRHTRWQSRSQFYIVFQRTLEYSKHCSNKVDKRQLFHLTVIWKIRKQRYRKANWKVHWHTSTACRSNHKIRSNAKAPGSPEIRFLQDVAWCYNVLVVWWWDIKRNDIIGINLIAEKSQTVRNQLWWKQ